MADALSQRGVERARVGDFAKLVVQLVQQILIRLAHLYSVGEHPTLSTPAQVDLKKIFAAQGLTVKSAEEMSLTGNQGLKEMDEAKLDFKTYEPYNYSNPKPYNKRVYMSDDLVVTLRPMELRTLLVELA